MKLTKEKGITLIALVITIIVLIILAGVSINLILGQNGLLKKAREAVIKNAQAAKEEEVQLAIQDVLIENDYDKSKVTVSAVLEKVKKNYTKQEDLNAITGASTGDVEDKFPGIITYDTPASTVDVAIIVEVDENLNVKSETNQPNPPVTIPDSEYKEVGETYYYTPEMIKFNPQNTYYITYDESGNNETVYGRLDKVDEPKNWYNYENKIWANLVTVNGDNVTYWTWIPRYMYKIGEEETVDIKFVDVKNNYEGKDKDTVNLEEYKLPESFTFAEQELKGYWISKYEVQEADSSELEQIEVLPSPNMISITTTEHSGTYTIFLNGEKYIDGVELPYNIEKLKSNTQYEICLVSETRRNIVGADTVKTNTNDSSKNIEVDTSGFNKANTYYVTYDEEGNNETIYGRMDKVEEPKDWYNYDKKIWANLVTVNGDNVTYWTYIPRYEYITYPAFNFTDVRYIKSTQTTADEGYKIPESFTFGEQNLKGYWISKYEVQEADSSELEQIEVLPTANTIDVTTTKKNGTYTIFIDGEKYKENVTLPHSIENLELNRDYEICVYNETSRHMIGNDIARRKPNDSSKNIEIDLTGFEPSCTYYVIYDENGGNEQIGGNIQVGADGKPTNAPSNWYNYDKKIWANIVTKGNGHITYWTYIPRYEYIAYPAFNFTDVRYIKSTQTTADERYKIPESFTFGEQNLKGYWISKYEVQEKQ